MGLLQPSERSDKELKKEKEEEGFLKRDGIRCLSVKERVKKLLKIVIKYRKFYFFLQKISFTKSTEKYKK